MPRLLNKTALITGGTSGIGLATARRFLEEGARVAVTGTNPDHLAEARKTLGHDVVGLLGDAGDVAAQQSIARAIGEAFGKLDALFVNAGLAQIRPLEQWDEAQFDRSIGVNLKGPFFLIQALLPIFANPGLDRAEQLDRRAYRHAGHHRVWRVEGGPDLAGEDLVGRTDRAWHQDERDKSRTDRDLDLRQHGAERGGTRCDEGWPGQSDTARPDGRTAGDRRRGGLFCIG